MARGCFIWVNIILDIVLVANSIFISGGSLIENVSFGGW
jgi:hypothetical protein